MCVRMRWCFISGITYVYRYEGNTWAHRWKLFDRPYRPYNKTLKCTKSKSIFAVSHSKLFNQTKTEDLAYLYVRFEKVSKFKNIFNNNFCKGVTLSSRKVCLCFIYKSLFKTRTFYYTYNGYTNLIFFQSFDSPSSRIPSNLFIPRVHTVDLQVTMRREQGWREASRAPCFPDFLLSFSKYLHNMEVETYWKQTVKD